MRNRFDQLVKLLSRDGLSPGGVVETEVEVSPDSLRIDIWFIPDARRAPKVLGPLGLLGRMALESCTFEPFHRTPSGEQVSDCLAKHRFFCRELARRAPRPPAPVQWILSAGRPSAGLAGWCFRASPQGDGLYEGPPLSRTRLVVVGELPRTRDTLIVRLMGAGVTLKRAVADLQALPSDAPERRLALPILLRLRLEIPTEPAKQTKSDREFLMRTQDVDRYLAEIERKGIEKGIEKGVEKGFAQAVLAAYRARFGAPPAALEAAIESAKDHAALERWLDRVTTGTADEVAAELRKTRARKAARPAQRPRGSSPRHRTTPGRSRAAAAR